MPIPLLPAARPIPLFNAAAVRRIEQAAAAVHPAHTLMQRAGLAVARLALGLAPHARTIWIACGPGNNGGDGLEAAMHLQNWGAHPVVTWLGNSTHAPADARASLAQARAAGVRFADDPPAGLNASDLAIDALLGLGVARTPAGRMIDCLHAMHSSPATVLAVDLPTGLGADTGVWSLPDNASLSIAKTQDASRAIDLKSASIGRRHTLSLLAAKPGLFMAEGRDACGTLWIDDLGVKPTEPPSAWLNAPAPLAPRPHASHKGTWGHVVVIGGACDRTAGVAMGGAALLAASAALHGGAGRVTVSLLGNDAPMLDEHRPELMFRSFDALALESMTAVCGCGGGQAVRDVLPAVLAQSPRLVLDADALNIVAQDTGLQQALARRAERERATVLTPHPLEAARLLARSTGEVQRDRLAAAQALATRWQCTVVLKGSGSVIASPAEVPRINPTGDARLATPGTGDVLAGLLGAYLAAGSPAMEAACRAVAAHGAAADAWPPGQPLTAAALTRQLGVA